jgi:hypothetical protein
VVQSVFLPDVVIDRATNRLVLAMPIGRFPAHSTIASVDVFPTRPFLCALICTRPWPWPLSDLGRQPALQVSFLPSLLSLLPFPFFLPL